MRLVSGDVFQIIKIVGILDLENYFFFNDTATTEIYTLSLHDALPISEGLFRSAYLSRTAPSRWPAAKSIRSEEHTSELQSPCNLVCRLLLDKKYYVLLQQTFVRLTQLGASVLLRIRICLALYPRRARV